MNLQNEKSRVDVGSTATGRQVMQAKAQLIEMPGSEHSVITVVTAEIPSVISKKFFNGNYALRRCQGLILKYRFQTGDDEVQ